MGSRDRDSDRALARKRKVCGRPRDRGAAVVEVRGEGYAGPGWARARSQLAQALRRSRRCTIAWPLRPTRPLRAMREQQQRQRLRQPASAELELCLAFQRLGEVRLVAGCWLLLAAGCWLHIPPRAAFPTNHDPMLSRRKQPVACPTAQSSKHAAHFLPPCCRPSPRPMASVRLCSWPGYRG
jgi:hypothetical protein